LTAGLTYYLDYQFGRSAYAGNEVKLYWSSNKQDKQLIAAPFAYRGNRTLVAADTAGSVLGNGQYWCVRSRPTVSYNTANPVFSPFKGGKYVISLWAKQNNVNCDNTDATAISTPTLSVKMYNGATATTTASLQPTGIPIEGWQRYETVVSFAATDTKAQIIMTAGTQQSLFIDDIRFQPFNSALKSFAYDPVSLRLIAELDENNYATFYQYDEEGTLNRVAKETERGIKTIQETRSNTLKQ
jgi:hypothetical protein